MEVVTIREAVSGDAAQLVELSALGRVEPSLVPPPPNEVAGAAAAIADIAETGGPSVVLVAEVDGVVVGTCQLIVFRHVQHGGGWCGEIESMHVRPDHRGSGIGGRLVEEAATRARLAGCYRIQLTSNLARTDAHRFYERHGFTGSHLGFKRLL